MINDDSSLISRRNLFGICAGFAAVAAAPVFAKAPGLIRNAGDIRSIKLYSKRTGESLDTVYWIEGEYIPEVRQEINFLMRDWRQNEIVEYDMRNIDVMAAARNLMGTTEAYQVVSGYRSKTTNDMLRRRNRGVARNSYHTLGMAADLKLRSRSVTQMASAAKVCRAGGVGKYSRSNFVHMDCGPVRTWGR